MQKGMLSVFFVTILRILTSILVYNAPASETKRALIVKHLFYCIKNHRKLFCGQNFVQVLIDPAIFSGDVA